MKLESQELLQLKPSQKFRFQWEEILKLFVVRQYAEFVTAIDICENIITGFPELCEDDIADHGEDEFKKYLLRAIYKLTPETIVFPKKYREPFDEFRKDYLNDADNSYLFHSKNRFQELDNMYASIMRAVGNESDSAEIRHLLQVGLNIIKESRAEQSSSKINIEASSDGKEVKITASGVPVNSLTTSEIEDRIKQYERGEPIDLPGPKKSLPDAGSGDGVPENGSSPAETGRDPETEG